MIENTWNHSVKIMFNLPRSAHRFLVEPVSESKHIKKIFVKRFLNFTKQIEKSSKVALRNVYNTVKNDCRSVTGSNLRNIMLLVDKTTIDSLCPEDHDLIRYAEIPENERWRVNMVKELTDVNWGENVIEGFSREELSYIMYQVCSC